MMVTKIAESDLKKLIIASATNLSHASFFVVDLAGLTNTDKDVIEALNAFMVMYSARIIVIATDCITPYLLGRLVDIGVYNIITELNNNEYSLCLTTGKNVSDVSSFAIEKPVLTTEIEEKEVIEPLLTKDVEKESISVEPLQNKDDTHHQQKNSVIMPLSSQRLDKPINTPTVPKPQREFLPKETIHCKKDFKNLKQFITVGICGTQRHIGTTHFALLTAKFLNSIGFKACYLEAKEVKEIINIANAYAVNADESINLLQYFGVDMYFDFSLAEVIKYGYDFYIFDLGSLEENNCMSFLTKDINCIVGGVKPWEMVPYVSVFKMLEPVIQKDKVNFIMNFAPENEKQDILSLMGLYRNKTFFSEYVPFPFSINSNVHIFKGLFADFIDVKLTRAIQEEPRKNKFFRGWK